jgi:uncharacterized protein (TIGR03067 family)
MIKKTIPLLVVGLLLIILVGVACTSTEAELVGEWQGNYQGDEIIMEFSKDGQFKMIVDPDEASGTYTLDTTKDPIWIDLTIEYGEGFEENETILTILEFIDEDTLRLQNNFAGEPRPESFTEDTLTMTRQ